MKIQESCRMKNWTVINIFLNILVLKYKKHNYAIKGEAYRMKAASLEPSLSVFCCSCRNIFFFCITGQIRRSANHSQSTNMLWKWATVQAESMQQLTGAGVLLWGCLSSGPRALVHSDWAEAAAVLEKKRRCAQRKDGQGEGGLMRRQEANRTQQNSCWTWSWLISAGRRWQWWDCYWLTF